MATDCNDIANIVALGIFSGDDDMAKQLADISLSMRQDIARVKSIDSSNLDDALKGALGNPLKMKSESDRIKIRAIVQAAILRGDKSKGAYVELAKQIKKTKGSISGGVNLLEKLSKVKVTDYETIARLWGGEGKPEDIVKEINDKLADFTATNYSISQYCEFKGDVISDIKKRLKDKKISKKQAEEELAKAHKTVMDKIKKGDAPSGYAKIDKERQAISKIAKGNEQEAMDMWTQYVMARELIADGDIDEDVLKIFSNNKIKDLVGPLTIDQINSYGKKDLAKLLARAYLNTKQLYSDGVLREVFRNKLVELASATNMTEKDIVKMNNLVRMENFAKEGMTFTDIMENNKLYETAKKLGLNVDGKTGGGLYEGLKNFCRKVVKEGIPEGQLSVAGIPMQPSDIIQLIFSATGDKNIIKLLNTGRFDDKTVLGVATQYLFGDKKGAESTILSLFNKSKTQPKIDDIRGLSLKTITGVNVTSDKPVGFYDYRKGLYIQDKRTRLKAQLFDKLTNRNKMKVPSGDIKNIQHSTNVDELVEKLSPYKGGYIVVNDSRWGDNKILREALDKINFKDGVMVSESERIDVLCPNRAIQGNFTYEKGNLYFKTADDEWFDEIAGTISIQSLGDAQPTREIEALQYEITTGKNGYDIRQQASYSMMGVDSRGRQLTNQQLDRFKKSVVRDERGRLASVYHGTRDRFNVPNMEKTKMMAYGPGMYFTTRRNEAEGYAYGRKNIMSFFKSKRVIEAYLDIRKPITEGVFDWDNAWLEQLEKKGYYIPKHYMDSLTDPKKSVLDKYNQLWMYQKQSDYARFIRDFKEITGYDGVKIDFGSAYTYRIVFTPEQIKYVDNKAPTFSHDMRNMSAIDEGIIHSGVTKDGMSYAIYDDGVIFEDGYRMWGQRIDNEGAEKLGIKLEQLKTAINKPSVVNGKTVKELCLEYNIPLYLAQDEFLRQVGNNFSLATTFITGAHMNGKDFVQSMITLRDMAVEGTVEHEFFHSVFLTMDKDFTDNFIKKAEKLYGLKSDGGHRAANEMLADLFSDYMRTGKINLPKEKMIGEAKGFKERVLKKFQEIKNWLGMVDDYQKELTKLFDDILNGKVKTTKSKLTKKELVDWNSENLQARRQSLIDNQYSHSPNTIAYQIKNQMVEKGISFDEAKRIVANRTVNEEYKETILSGVINGVNLKEVVENNSLEKLWGDYNMSAIQPSLFGGETPTPTITEQEIGKPVDQVKALAQYDKEINNLATRYYGEMLGVTGENVDEEYIDRVQNLLSDITGIDIKAFSEIQDKAKLWEMVDERFALDKLVAGKYDKDFVNVKEISDYISGLSDEDVIKDIKNKLGNLVGDLSIDNEQLPLLREVYFDLLTSPTEVDYLTAKGKLISLANGGKAESISLEQLRGMFNSGNFEDGYSMFLNGLDDEQKKIVIKQINDNVFDILTIKFSENLVAAGYDLPLIKCKSLLYNYLKNGGTPDINDLFVKALFTKNDIPMTVDNLKTLLDEMLPKDIDFDYVSGLYKGRLENANGEMVVFTETKNAFLPDSFSALVAMERAQTPEASGGYERKILQEILNKYLEECKKTLTTNGGFKKAQQLKQDVGYALDVFEQDILLPKFGRALTYQERKQLLGMKYALPIVVGGEDPKAALGNLENITQSLLDKFDEALNTVSLKESVNASIADSIGGAKQEEKIAKRTEQLAKDGYTLKNIGGEYVVYDSRQAVVDALNPNNLSSTIGGLDSLKGIQLRQLEGLSNQQVYSLLRYIELAKVLDGSYNLGTKVIYKNIPQLAKIDFFRTFKIDSITGLPKALVNDTLCNYDLFKNIDTAGVDRDIKEGIFKSVKDAFNLGGFISQESLSKVVKRVVSENIENLARNVDPNTAKKMESLMNKVYVDAFVPYTYLRDLPTGGILANGESLVNVKERVDNIIKGAYKNTMDDIDKYGDPTFHELLKRITITTADGEEIPLENLAGLGIDYWKKDIFDNESMFVKSAEDMDAPKPDTTKQLSDRQKNNFKKKEKKIRENIVNQYNSTVNAVLSDIQIVTDADRNIMGALFPTVRQLMRKYTLTQKMANATDRVLGLNEEVSKGIKTYLLGFKGRVHFLNWGNDEVISRLKEVQQAYKSYYKLGLARLATIEPTTSAEGLALKLAKYFKTLEDALGSVDGIKGCTTKTDINRAFYHIGEVFLNIESVPGIYGILSAVEQNQILKFFRYSKSKNLSYVKKFDLKRGKGSGALSHYRDFVQDVVGLSTKDFNEIFGTAFSEKEYKKVIQGLAGFTLSGTSNALIQKLQNIVSGSTLLGRLMLSYPFQIITIPQQSTAYFFKLKGQERRLGISSINEIDKARMKYGGVLDGAYNELSLRNLKSVNPDSLDVNAYYNRYGIPNIEEVYDSVGDIELTDTVDDIHSKIKNAFSKSSSGLETLERRIDPYKDNANNIVDGVFYRDFKNVAFFKALKENEIFRFGSIEQFTAFMDNPNINPSIKKQLMDRVEELAGRNFRNMLGVGFGGLDRAVSGHWLGNVAYGLMNMLNFRGAWGWNIFKQTSEAIATGFKMIFKNGFLSKEARENVLEYVSKQPEFLNFVSALYNDLLWSWRISRFNDNGERPEDDEYGMMDFMDYIGKSMNMTSQWYQGLESFGPFRPFQEARESYVQSRNNPDIYKDKYGMGAFINSLFKNFGRQWKPRNYIIKALGYWTQDKEMAKAYIENEFWKSSAGTLRYMVGEQEGAYGYTYDFYTTSGKGIPSILAGETNRESDKQFGYDIDNTSTRESLKLAFNADTLIDDKKVYRSELLKGILNGSQFFSFFKNVKNFIKGDWVSPFTAEDYAELATKCDAGKEFYRKGYVTPTTSVEARKFFDMILNNGKYRPGSQSFNNSVVQFDETGHMDGDTGNAADEEMEIWLNDMKYDDNGEITEWWNVFIGTVKNNFYDKTSVQDFILKSSKDWLNANSDNPNYNLYEALLGQGELSNLIEKRVDKYVEQFNLWAGKKADERWDEGEWESVYYNQMLLNLGESEFEGQGRTFFQQMQLLDKDTSTEYALAAISRGLSDQDAKELEKFYTVSEDENGIDKLTIDYKFKEQMIQLANMERDLEDKNIEGFLADASSIANPYLDKDPTGLVTAEIISAINDRVNSAEWLSAKEKSEIMISLFHNNRQYIERNPEKLKEALGEDYDKIASEFNERIHERDEQVNDNIETMQLQGEGGGDGGTISRASSLSSSLKAIKLPTSDGTGTRRTGRGSYKEFIPTQIKGSELLKALGLNGYSPKDMYNISVEGYKPNVSFKINKDTKRSKPSRKSTQAISNSKLLSKLEDKTEKAIEAES